MDSKDNSSRSHRMHRTKRTRELGEKFVTDLPATLFLPCFGCIFTASNRLS